MNSTPLRPLLALAATLILAACGGGGGSSSPAPGESSGQNVQDILPTGDRLDLRSRNYFPAASGDTWTYNRVQGGTTTANAVTRTVADINATEFNLNETYAGTTDATHYRRSPGGNLIVNLLGASTPAAAQALVGDIVEYPEPFYPVGGTRQIIRQGKWGADVDGDGIEESFRLELTQVLVGLETRAIPHGSAETAHFRTTMKLTLIPTRAGNNPYAVTGTEETWWGPGIGLVRAERVATDSNNAIVEPAYALEITAGTVGGTSLFTADGAVTRISLPHNALVYDPGRKRYYASIPGSVALTGNSIATIDATTGAVSYSAAVGSEPTALAIAADGSALYVGLNGSGDVVKLALPGMAELRRTRLPTSTPFGQQLAEQIAVSPTDADIAAVSLVRPGVSPRHGGVVLIRAGVVQARMTQEHTGSNLIAFDANGQFLYGLNNETTEFGLRKIAVLADGLTEQFVVATAGGFGARSLDWSAQGLILDRTVYRTSDLSLAGTVGAPDGGCRAYPTLTNRLVCLYSAPTNGGDGRLAVVDAGTFVIAAAPAYALASNGTAPSQIITGPAGQVALRFGATYWNQPASSLWLFTGPDLQ